MVAPLRRQALIKISKEDFEKPENLAIKINCEEKLEEEGEEGEEIKKIVPEEDTDF